MKRRRLGKGQPPTSARRGVRRHHPRRDNAANAHPAVSPGSHQIGSSPPSIAPHVPFGVRRAFSPNRAKYSWTARTPSLADHRRRSGRKDWVGLFAGSGNRSGPRTPWLRPARRRWTGVTAARTKAASAAKVKAMGFMTQAWPLIQSTVNVKGVALGWCPKEDQRPLGAPSSRFPICTMLGAKLGAIDAGLYLQRPRQGLRFYAR